MKELKKTREDDRIAANLRLHKKFMDDHVAGGIPKDVASRMALTDLHHLTMTQRIKQANDMRRTTQ